MKLKNLSKKEAFEFYTDLDLSTIPDEWKAVPGTIELRLKLHSGRIISETSTLPVFGFPVHQIIKDLIRNKYLQYEQVIHTYCRPLGTTHATFKDFNRPQQPVKPNPPELSDRIINLIIHFLAVKPILPIYFIDTFYAKTPLSTGTGYHNRHSFKRRANAKYSHPPEYPDKPTYKGYFINATADEGRMLIHRIKHTGLPFEYSVTDPPTDDEIEFIIRKLNNFFNAYPTMLFTRNHISKRTGPLKQRPVYAADELSIMLECMLTFPLHLQARNMDCSIMYSLETIRGANCNLDQSAQKFKSFMTIDWSSFDQTVPHVITDIFFSTFLPR